MASKTTKAKTTAKSTAAKTGAKSSTAKASAKTAGTKTTAASNGRRRRSSTTNGRRTPARSNGRKRTISVTGGKRSTSDGVPPTANELQALVAALRAVRDGDFNVRLQERRGTVMGEIAAMFNDVVELNGHRATELERVARVVGREGRMTVRLSHGRGAGQWATSIDSVNALIDDL
ncbi:MAG: hypothetical protein ACRDKT_17705, partial [Actinomycetota bacterium]